MLKSATRTNDGELQGRKIKYWSTTVPSEIVALVSDEEKKRQEAIFEVIQKEKEYVDDLDLVHKVGCWFCLRDGVEWPAHRLLAISFTSNLFVN